MEMGKMIKLKAGDMENQLLYILCQYFQKKLSYLYVSRRDDNKTYDVEFSLEGVYPLEGVVDVEEILNLTLVKEHMQYNFDEEVMYEFFSLDNYTNHRLIADDIEDALGEISIKQSK